MTSVAILALLLFLLNAACGEGGMGPRAVLLLPVMHAAVHIVHPLK